MSAGVLNLEGCLLLSAFYDTDPRYSFTLSGTASGTVKNCVVRPSRHSSVASTAYLNTSGTVDVDNTLILGAASHGLICAGTGTYKIRNSLVTGGHKNSSAFPIIRSGGTLSVGNTLVVANPFDGAKTISGTYTDLGGNTLTSLNPKFVQNARKGYIIPCIDDSVNFTHALEIEALLSAKGFSGSYFIETLTWSTENTSALREMVARGVMEAGTHTRTHSSMRSTGKIWDVVKDAETITISRAADVITLSGGGEVLGFRSKSLADIKIELEALGATVTPSTLYSTTFSVPGKVYHLALGEILESTMAGNVVNILIDNTAQSGFFKTEIVDSKIYLEAQIGDTIDPQTGVSYSCNSFGAPFNATSTDSRLACMAAGLLSARGMLSTDTSATLGKHNHATDIYNIYVFDAGTSIKGDGTEEVVRRNARALAFAVAESGLCVCILSHTSSQFSIEQWAWALEEFAVFGDNINVCSQQRFALDVRSQGWSESFGVYSKPLTDADGDYHLLPTSPCIGAGLDVGLTTDFDGNAAPGALGYDIGPYSYMPGWTPFDESMPTLSLSPDAPGKLRSVQTWKKVASAKEIGKL